jgi:hypothetical protein
VYQTLKANGDLFEREHYSWFESTLPAYEAIWQRVIGNDGSNQPVPIDNHSPD